jgi:hypothetical protein
LISTTFTDGKVEPTLVSATGLIEPAKKLSTQLGNKFEFLSHGNIALNFRPDCHYGQFRGVNIILICHFDHDFFVGLILVSIFLSFYKKFLNSV